jgi:hypothetical protein
MLKVTNISFFSGNALRAMKYDLITIINKRNENTNLAQEDVNN